MTTPPDALPSLDADLKPPTTPTTPTRSPSPSSYDQSISTPAGCYHPSVYTRLLPRWRSKAREWFVWHLEENELPWLEFVQKSVRCDFLDWYFAQASLLGTHTFFLLFLPLFYWFGFPHLGASVVHTLSIGIYVTSFLKDMFCVPRPYCPPLQRLTSGTTHDLEYGFPSTHSTNSMSMGLFLIADVLKAFPSTSASSTNNTWELYIRIISTSLLTLYIISVILSRIYCGMHSFIDCTVGAFLGVAVFYLSLAYEDSIAEWTASVGWWAPLIAVPLALALVSVHPEPVDDCPCFEDAIAIISVSLGIYIAHWHITNYGIEMASFTRGSPLKPDGDFLVFMAAALAKVIGGVALIFLWRLVAKETLHAALPPIFRVVARLAPYFILPRRHYTVATQYKKYESADAGLHPIPSVLDLTDLNNGQLTEINDPIRRLTKRKNGNGEKGTESENVMKKWRDSGEEKGDWEGPKPSKKIKHYDVDGKSSIDPKRARADG